MKYLVRGSHTVFFNKSRSLLLLSIVITAFCLVKSQVLNDESQKTENWILSMISGVGLVTSGHLLEINRIKSVLRIKTISSISDGIASHTPSIVVHVEQSGSRKSVRSIESALEHYKLGSTKSLPK